MHFPFLVVVLALLSLLAQSNPVSWPWRWGRENEAPSVGTPLESPIRADDSNSAVIAQSSPVSERDYEAYNEENPPQSLISSNSLDSIKEVIDNSVNFREIAQVILPRIEDWFIQLPLHPRFSTITNSSSIFTTIAGYVVESERGISPIAFISSSNETETNFQFETPALEAEVKLRLCYRASEHDFLASEFHRLCDGKGATITLVKGSTDKMAAAYNSVSWRVGGYTLNPSGFQVSIAEGPEEGGGYVFKKYAAIASTMAMSYFGSGPCFEKGMFLSDRCNENIGSFSTIYLQEGYIREGMTEREYLLGSKSGFRVSEYEVFQVELI
jgi:hypothetical protein